MRPISYVVVVRPPFQALAAAALFAALPASANAQGVSFALQFTSPQGNGTGVEAIISDPAGGGYAGGSSWGDLYGPNAGVEDAFIVRIDDNGNTLWSTQFGTNQSDFVDAFAADGNGGVFVVGDTRGDLAAPNQGAEDIFIAHYDANGNQLGIRQFGDIDQDLAFGATPDGSGGFVISGWTNGTLGVANLGGLDAFIARFDSDGNEIWFNQFGTAADDEAGRVVSDGAGGFLVAGMSQGSLGGPNAGLLDAFIARFDSNGVQTWITQFGTASDDAAFGVVADGTGGGYLSGGSMGSLFGANQGAVDIVLARFDAAGTILWGVQAGSSAEEFSESVVLLPSGGAVAMSTTSGNLAGPSNGGLDIALNAYDENGNPVWADQIGTANDEEALGMTGDGVSDDITIGGNTFGAMYAGARNSGAEEAFVLTYSPTFSCYADCDTSTNVGVLAELDLFDFLCFQGSFVTGQTYACDCDTSTGLGNCDLFDFLCFQGAFVNGCR